MIPTVSIPEGSLGPWTVKRKIVKDDFARMRLAFSGRSPGEIGDVITMLVHNKRGVVMSDSRAERRDHIGFVANAKGRVLINGLGLGMCLAAALAKVDADGSPVVTRATVVEVDPDVIALVGAHYQSDPRVEIVHASAFDYQPPKGASYGAVWHDIWDTICADNLPEMTRLHRKYGRRADWQGSWCCWECDRAKRQERKWF